jgi:hypothetical protein
MLPMRTEASFHDRCLPSFGTYRHSTHKRVDEICISRLRKTHHQAEQSQQDVNANTEDTVERQQGTTSPGDRQQALVPVIVPVINLLNSSFSESEDDPILGYVPFSSPKVASLKNDADYDIIVDTNVVPVLTKEKDVPMRERHLDWKNTKDVLMFLAAITKEGAHIPDVGTKTKRWKAVQKNLNLTTTPRTLQTRFEMISQDYLEHVSETNPEKMSEEDAIVENALVNILKDMQKFEEITSEAQVGKKIKTTREKELTSQGLKLRQETTKRMVNGIFTNTSGISIRFNDQGGLMAKTGETDPEVELVEGPVVQATAASTPNRGAKKRSSADLVASLADVASRNRNAMSPEQLAIEREKLSIEKENLKLKNDIQNRKLDFMNRKLEGDLSIQKLKLKAFMMQLKTQSTPPVGAGHLGGTAPLKFDTDSSDSDIDGM